MRKRILYSTLLLTTFIFSLAQKGQLQKRKEVKIETKISQEVNRKLNRNLDVDLKNKKRKKQKTATENNTKMLPIKNAEFIKEYKKISKKYLHSKEESNKRSELLQSEKMIRKSFLYLTDIDESEPINQRIENSMDVINFLSDAVAWSDNPLRADAIEKAKYFLLNDRLSTIENERFLRSVATDKAELYLILMRDAPEVAKEIRESSRGTKLAFIIQYAENNM